MSDSMALEFVESHQTFTDSAGVDLCRGCRMQRGERHQDKCPQRAEEIARHYQPVVDRLAEGRWGTGAIEEFVDMGHVIRKYVGTPEGR